MDIKKKITPQLVGEIVAMLIKEEYYEELNYILAIDKQIIQQTGWIDREDMPIELLGNYNSRGGIKQGDITVILNFMDLYDVYKNGVKIAEDIYCDELYYAVRERLI